MGSDSCPRMVSRSGMYSDGGCGNFSLLKPNLMTISQVLAAEKKISFSLSIKIFRASSFRRSGVRRNQSQQCVSRSSLTTALRIAPGDPRATVHRNPQRSTPSRRPDRLDEDDVLPAVPDQRG